MPREARTAAQGCADRRGGPWTGHRIYDPRLARFLQADPLIEDGSTLNRYTYVHNDPLAYTDPSGYLSQRAERFLRTAVAVAISVWSGGALSGAAWAGVGTTISSAGLMTKLAFAMSNGLLAGAIQSGTVEGAAWGAFSAGVFFGIGQGLQGAGQWAEGSFLGSKLSPASFAVKTVSHGLAGGTISHLQGGKFGHGFASAAGSAATAPLVDASAANVVRGAVVTTLVGGTLSRISGGNFANGALTAAMSYAFNRVASSNGRESSAVTQEETALEITYVRFWETSESTIGEFRFVDSGSVVKGYFLEPPGPSSTVRESDLRIMEGRYSIVPHSGRRFRDHFRLTNVPGGRGPIVFHTGNTAADTEGCLIPGQTRGVNRVYGSRQMLRPLDSALRNYHRAFITIDRGFRGGFE
jgi:hypothetical protein